MGCGSSKLDNLPAVALCRDRCGFLDEAMRLRFALAEAHLAYMQSLKDVGGSLQGFFDQDVDVLVGSPVLLLPGVKKNGAVEVVEPSGSSSSELSHSHHLVLDSDSGSDSHLDLNSDSEEEGEASSDSFHHHQLQGGFTDPLLNAHHADPFGYSREFQPEFPGGFSRRFTHMYYMKNQAAPSVLYEQKQFSAETGYMDQSSYFDYGVYGHQKAMAGSSHGEYLNYGGGYYRTAHQYGDGVVAVGSRDDYKSPPPPPSPPRGSAWDFLNPFESVYDASYSAYPSSRELKEVREEEGIPELEEEEEVRHETVKEVYDKKQADVVTEVARAVEKSEVGGDSEIEKVKDVDMLSPRRPSLVEDDRLEYEVHSMEAAKVVEREERITAGVSGEDNTKDAEPRGVSDVVKDIQALFERAAEAGDELAALLEAGRLPYHKKHGAYPAPSEMLHAITPSLPMVFSHPSKSGIAQSSSLAVLDAAATDIDEVTGMKTKGLSITLQKLYLWEKKLCNEVKAEEKMRVIHDRKRRKLMQLDSKGADADKVVSTRALVRSLGTKIKVAIQVVDRISSTLNRIRDEELWPQVNQLIQGLSSMWKSMLECHRSQFQAIRDGRNLDTVISNRKFSEANLKATSDLEHELINWALRFTSWVGSQREFAKSLNNWLFKCLLYEPEETPDGVVPFSPGRIGAPPIFLICNQWVQALDQISEKEVVDAMRGLAMSVFSFWERDRLILRQNMVTNKELERQVRSLDREDHKIQKQIHALDKRVVSVSRASSGLPGPDQVVYQSDTSNATLQDSLQHVFCSMEQFTAESSKVYDELLQRIEEERLASANPDTS
uniref:BZIP transcription factor n=1 Tax=Kalanchoe fedtschenkoi TaxID=63787 RepID=A0A7N0UZQ2_KALFE